MEMQQAIVELAGGFDWSQITKISDDEWTISIFVICLKLSRENGQVVPYHGVRIAIHSVISSTDVSAILPQMDDPVGHLITLLEQS